MVSASDARAVGGAPVSGAPGDRPLVAVRVPQRRVRALLGGDHQVLVEGLNAVLAPFHETVAVARPPFRSSTAGELLRAADSVGADVVVLEVSRARLGLITDLLALRPSLPILAIGHDNDDSCLEALAAGARGYVFTSLDGEKLSEAIASVAAGERVIDPKLVARVIGAAVDRSSNRKDTALWPGAHLGLGRRESEVLVLLGEGLRNRDIAERLQISEETVKSHAAGVYRKLGVKDRAQAVAKALREGIIT